MYAELGALSKEDYQFQHMVSMDAFLVYNMAKVGKRL